MDRLRRPRGPLLSLSHPPLPLIFETIGLPPPLRSSSRSRWTALAALEVLFSLSRAFRLYPRVSRGEQARYKELVKPRSSRGSRPILSLPRFFSRQHGLSFFPHTVLFTLFSSHCPPFPPPLPPLSPPLPSPLPHTVLFSLLSMIECVCDLLLVGQEQPASPEALRPDRLLGLKLLLQRINGRKGLSSGSTAGTSTGFEASLFFLIISASVEQPWWQGGTNIGHLGIKCGCVYWWPQARMRAASIMGMGEC